MSKFILPKNFTSDVSFFTLENGMKVCTFSDNHFTQSRMDLCVRCGTYCDPADLPGLAHFCEHMLYLGTEKYPEEGYFMKFLSTHGGTDNASTLGEQTQYYFEINPDALGEAADIFVNFFISPLFTESATEREVQAIENEYCGYKVKDTWRDISLTKRLSDPEHPFSHFTVGSRETLLGIPASELNKILRDYFNKYYSADNMILTIIGPQSTEELKKIAELFAAVPRRKTERIPLPLDGHHPLRPCDTAKIVSFVPVKDTHEITVAWPVPGLRKRWRTLPQDYLSSLIGDETEGSILYLLKSKGWATGLVADISDILTDAGLAICGIKVTEEGLAHKEDVVEIVFQYVNMLRSMEPSKRFYDELNNQNIISYTLSPMKSMELVQSRVMESMLLDVPEEYFYMRDMYSLEWNPDEIKEILSYLKPENAIVFYKSKTFADICDKKEKWFDVEYHEEKMTEEFLKRLAEAKVPPPAEGKNPTLFLKRPNEFISTLEDCLNRMDVRNENLYRDPVNIGIEGKCEWFCLEDHNFNDHLVYTYLRIRSPNITGSSFNVVCSVFFSLCFEQQINELLYFGTCASLDFTIDSSSVIALKFGGLRGKYSIFFKRVLEELRHFKLDRKIFDICKEQTLRKVKSWKDSSIPSIVESVSRYLFDDNCTNVLSLFLPVVEKLTYEDLLSWIERFWADGLYIQAMTVGNYTIDEDRELMKLLLSIFDAPEVPKDYFKYKKYRFPLNEGVREVNFKAFGSDEENYIKNLYYFSTLEKGKEVMPENVYSIILDRILGPVFYDVLRTQQQLGYFVMASGEPLLETYTFKVYILSSTHDPEELNSRIDQFFVQMLPNLESLTDDALNGIKENLILELNVKPVSVKGWIKSVYSEINGTYRWNSIEQMCNAIRKVTKEELIAAYKRVFIPGDEKDTRSVLSLRVYANPEQIPPEKASQVKDLQDLPDIKESIPYIAEIPGFTSFYEKGK